MLIELCEHLYRDSATGGAETKTIPAQQPPPDILEDGPSSSKPREESKKEESEAKEVPMHFPPQM